MSAPLAGSTVLEFADYVTGPYAAVLLADLGARVIKIENPERGDPFRGWGQGGYSPTFRSVNRNKESIALDLRSEEGRSIAARLAQRSDVFIQNHRPGVAERLGLGYDELTRANPRLVYCSISGFGQEGPYRDRPGYDTIGQAMGGLLGLLTDAGSPKPMGISLSDHLAGLFAAYGILAAIVDRERTGLGQLVETSLLQATVSFVGENAARYFDSGAVPDREHRTHIAQVYAFPAGDELPFVIHLSSPQKFFAALAAAVGRPELVTDPRFVDREARIAHYAELDALLREVFATRPRAHWLARLDEHDVPAAPINNLAEVFADPQVETLRMVQEVEHPTAGSSRLVRNGVTIGARHEDDPISPPPLLGEHTAAILGELGCDDGQVRRLAQQGAPEQPA
jgi:formyl-CoA transferase